MFRGHNNIVYVFCAIIDFTEMFVMSLDFADVKKQRKHVQRNEIQDALSPSIVIFLMRQYNIRINPYV